MRHIPSEGGEGCTFPRKTFLRGTDDLVLCNDMGVQIIALVSAVFAIRAGKPAGMTVVVSVDVGHEIGTPGERPRTQRTEEGTRMFAVGKKMDLHRDTEDRSKGAVGTGMTTFRFGGMCAYVGLEGLVQTEGSWADRAMEGMVRGDGIVVRHRLRSKAMNDVGVEFVAFREMFLEDSSGVEVLGAEGALVIASLGVEEDVELKVAVARASEGTMGAAEM